MLAIALNRRDFRETDQIVTLYSQDRGKLELLAKGIKKITSKYSGNLFPGALVEIDIAQGRDIDHLTKVRPVCLFRNIRERWRKSLLINYILELVERMTEAGEKDWCLFDLLRDWLEFIDKSKVANDALVYSFIAKLFARLGFAAEIGACVKCAAPDNLMAFSLEDGGLVCDKCLSTIEAGQEMIVLNQRQLANLRIMFQGDWAAVNQFAQSQTIFNLVHAFAQYHSEKKLSKFNTNKLCQH